MTEKEIDEMANEYANKYIYGDDNVELIKTDFKAGYQAAMKENEKLKKYWAQVDTLEHAEKNCDLGDSKMVQVFMHPHRDMLGMLVPLIRLTEHEAILAGVEDQLQACSRQIDQFQSKLCKYDEALKVANEALEFYATQKHIQDLKDDLENPSGEPSNWVCDSDDKFNLENGGVAEMAQQQIEEILGEAK